MWADDVANRCKYEARMAYQMQQTSGLTRTRLICSGVIFAIERVHCYWKFITAKFIKALYRRVTTSNTRLHYHNACQTNTYTVWPDDEVAFSFILCASQQPSTVISLFMSITDISINTNSTRSSCLHLSSFWPISMNDYRCKCSWSNSVHSLCCA